MPSSTMVWISRLHLVAMLARDDLALFDRLAQQPEQDRIGVELFAIGALQRGQRALQLVIGGVLALDDEPQLRVPEA